MKCKSCGKESPATLCNMCFLEEVTEAIDVGLDQASEILKRIVGKYGRLKNLKRLPIWKAIFGKKKIRRVITTETGERCRLVPSYDGWVAICEGPASEAVEMETPEGKVTRLPGQSLEGSRIVTYYEGQVPILEIRKPTALIFPKPRGIKRSRRAFGKPPPKGYRSPQAYKRPSGPSEKELEA